MTPREQQSIRARRAARARNRKTPAHERSYLARVAALVRWGKERAERANG